MSTYVEGLIGVPTFPNHLSRGLPSSGRDCRNGPVWLCSIHLGAWASQSLNISGLLFYFLENERVKRDSLPSGLLQLRQS